MDIGEYCLRMLNLGFKTHLDQIDKNIKCCISALERAKIINSSREVMKKELIPHLQGNQINPFYL